ncbi:acyl-CoA synthetase [Novosphingobium tardum]|uniref:Acyl-CoA synthetase n=1 Tax=Novosphingobium tardum TaxID=1538021 RepID=A0ABV8RRC8_9SPHN
MTHPRIHAEAFPERLAIVMSDTGKSVTCGELEKVANQGAQLFRSLGIETGQTVAVWLPNCVEFLCVYWAAQRAGLYITPVATALTGEEAHYILDNSEARLLVSSDEIAGLADIEANRPSKLAHILRLHEWYSAIAAMPSTPIADESAGFHMVYSSGTTGRPKGIRLPLAGGDPTAPHMLAERAALNYGIGPGSVYLSPAPLYHTAPIAFCTSCHRLGATVVVMPRFDPEAWLQTVERYKVTVTQMVPTMFVRLLKLPDAARLAYDVSSLRHVIHAAAPCPVEIKHRMIEWLGPIIQEYYGGSEGNGSTNITAEEWLRKPGSVGKASWGKIHICDDEGNELPPHEPGIVYFEGGWDFQYLGDPDKTRDSRHPRHPGWSALGDIGYLDEDGYLFLTDRKSYMIISGGVNIYPQEVENLLITHPKVADAAVIGVPNPDFGEEVKAVVQPLDPADATPAFAQELIAHCRAHLSPVKCPRSVDFDMALPRLDNGKLYKRLLKDRYWGKTASA